MRTQDKLTFYVGYDARDDERYELDDKFEHEVIRAASKISGGCTVLQGTGYWCEDGADHKVIFTSEVQSEHVFILELTCETHKTQAALESMKIHISAWASHLGIDTQWVHVTKQTFTGLHFDCVKHANTMPANLYRDIVSPGTRGAHE